MALKPDRIEAYTDISFFMNEVAERGGVVVHSNSVVGSGISMDDPDAVVTYAANQSGRAPAGVLPPDDETALIAPVDGLPFSCPRPRTCPAK